MAPLGALVATQSLGCSMVACRSGKPSEMALSDEMLYFILEVVALVGVVPVVIMESVVLCRVPSSHVLPNRWRPLIRSIVDCSLKYLCSRTYQSCVVSELGLILQVLRPLAVIARRLLGPLVLLFLAAACPVFAGFFLFL